MCDDYLDYDLKTFVGHTMHYNVTYLAVFLRIIYDQARYPYPKCTSEIILILENR